MCLKVSEQAVLIYSTYIDETYGASYELQL